MRFPRMTTRRWMVAVAIAALGAWRVKQERFLALYWGVTLLGSFLGIVLAGGRRRRLLGSVQGAAIASACVWFANFFVYQRYTFVTAFRAPKEPFTEAMAGAILGSFVGLVVGIAASLDYRRSLSWLWWRDPDPDRVVQEAARDEEGSQIERAARYPWLPVEPDPPEP
jgi:hypothetical protein